MDRRQFGRLGLGTAAAALGGAVPVLAQAPRFVTILTGGTSGVYYPLGVALSQIYGKAMPQTKFSVQATKASAENLNLLQAGRGELAFTQTDTLVQAVRGDAEVGFAKPLDKLRSLAVIYPNYIQIVASKASGIRSLADLKGKRVSVGAPKSGTELNARAVVKAAGLTYGDFAKVEYLPFAESVDLMKNQQLDATLQSAGLGVASLRDLASAIDITVVPVSAETVARIGEAVYRSAMIPANTYKGQDADVPTVVTGNALATHDGLSDAAAYQMTKLMFENLDVMQSAHAAARQIALSKDAATEFAPLHPGAKRFYQEKGLL
ncbi:C4-dicarboxylate ABC transporter [Niveispirillum lacus]|uniref:C4-dicarboxylate ABC transporter n=2 Tax=Niveispirillum lacus TaxID=1981099 RepID=A0A255Z849_9PROT|nr:TAXI family TRAP transporter solute-binding subunit [Niveispirillum lacus]OYQ37733.1 C4-dicarboxylate ABC transporter [Niveispirillum lacus]